MSKRSHYEAHGSGGKDEDGGSPAAKMTISLGSGRLISGSAEPILFTRVRSLEELDKRTLQLQNKKLWEHLTERQAVISELRERIEQLENRQAKDDALLCVINRYWNQLDEDSLIMLQRFDSDIEEEISTSTESFLKQLACWDKEEVPEKLQERVHFSKRIIARLISAYERLVVRQSRLRQMNQIAAFRTASSSEPMSSDASSDHPSTDAVAPSAGRNLLPSSVPESSDLNALCEEITQLNKENQRLQSLCTNLHAKHRQSSLQLRELQDLAQSRLESAAEWQAKYEDLDYKLSEAMSQVTRLDHRLYDTQQLNKQLEVDLAAFKGTDSGNNDDSTGSATSGLNVNRTKYNDLVGELEEVRELLNNRTSELERLQVKWAEKVGENEVLSMKCQEISEEQILKSPQYQSIKTQFNILYNEAIQLRTHLDEARTTLQNNRLNHIKHVEEMEVNEAAIQNQMRSEMLHMESQISQLRRAHETMELDFKQALAHNEQAGPINSEMRSLISTLQTQNKQLKAEVSRYRRKCREVNQDLDLVKSDLKATEEELTQVRQSLSEASARVASFTTPKDPVTSVPGGGVSATEPTLSDLPNVKLEPGSSDASQPLVCPACHKSSTSLVKCAVESDPINIPPSSEEVIRDLKEKLERSQEAQKEMSVLLNMYKVIPKDQRDKAALLQSEAKLRSELSDLKAEVERVHASLHESRQTNRSLQQQLNTMKQQVPPKVTRDSPFVKVSPADFTPPFPGTPVPQHGSASAASPAAAGAFKQLSPEDKSANPSSAPQQPHTPTTVSELQLELQLHRRRKQTLEIQLELHQNRLLAAQQQEEVLLKEMEVTGQAFEDVQEQNVRLVGNLREKDDTNLKLMTERLKTAQLARLLKDDKHLLEEQIRLMAAKVEALTRSVCKQEDKERLLLSNLDALEKQANARLQAQEAFKRKALESQQVAEDLRVTVQKYQSQLKESQVSVQEKASAFERISFRHQRLQEEAVSIRRKYERLRKIEQSHNADEVLLAEIQDYKEQLTCPTCKTNRKDAILTKCFHVFCLHCLKTRYETRNRKCPKCNATFGANDYHRIYLS